MGAIEEQRLISAVLRTGDTQTAKHRGVNPSFFDCFKEEWEWIEERLRATKRPPTKTDFKLHFPSFTIKAVDDVGLYSADVIDSHAKALFHGGMSTLIDNFQQGMPMDQLLARLQAMSRDVSGVVGNAGSMSQAVRSFKDSKRFYAEVARRHRERQNGVLGVPWGMPTLDESTGGILPGWLSIFASRPNVGKSWLLHRFALSVAKAGKTALVVSLEMNGFSVHTRLVSLHSGMESSKHGTFDPSALRQGTLGRSGVLALKRFLNESQIPGDIHVLDGADEPVTPHRVEAALDRFTPDVLILDYLQLFARLNSPSGSDLRLEVARWSSKFKEIAELRKIAVITASQLNRAGESRNNPPSLSALAESDSPGQDSDLVVTMVPPSQDVIKAAIAKNREGPAGSTFWVHKDPSAGIVEECTKEVADDLIVNGIVE